MNEMLVVDDKVEMILTFVPEAEYLSYEESLMLALDRDEEAAYDLFMNIYDAAIQGMEEEWLANRKQDLFGQG